MGALSPDQAVAEAKAQKLRPVYLVAGEEPYLISMVVAALREAALTGGVAGLNEDQLSAAESAPEDALSAARTLPMLAPRRLVVVRQVERWEPKTGEDAARPSQAKDAFEKLLSYAEDPSPTSTLLLVASGLDKRRRLYTRARNDGWLVSCEALSARDLPAFIERHARARAARFSPGVAELLAQLLGPELGPIADAIDRLALYAGPDSEITEAMLGECVVRLRTATVWQLVSAVGRRNLGEALSAFADVFEPTEAVRLVALLAWSTRQLIRFESALAEGLGPGEAAVRAGAPPFKARDLAEQARKLPRPVLERWIVTLVEMDRDLKGGSRLPARAVLERGLFDLCASGRPAPAPAGRVAPA